MEAGLKIYSKQEADEINKAIGPLGKAGQANAEAARTALAHLQL
jgi:hypothetical protein